MLDYVKRNTELPMFYQTLIQNDPEFLEKVKRLAQYKVLDMRPGHENESKSISNVDNHNQLIDAIYQIRCNLFQWSKEWN
jgi:hypothetical protein